MSKSNNLISYRLSDINNVKVHGRCGNKLTPLALFWTGSGIEFNCRGSELLLQIESDYDLFEQWITIVIDGVQVSRMMIPKGINWITIFRGMDKEKVKNIKIIKDVQPMPDDDKACLIIHNVKFDGTFERIIDKPYKIEFVGDSITSGEGAIGAKCEEEWVPMWFSAVNNYTYLTSEILNADYRIISASGWGVLTSWDNNPNCNIPQYYEEVCGIVHGENNKELGAFEKNDFKSWQPDIIVVNLGTNDAGAFTSPGWKDEKTGMVFKQRFNQDGTYNENDIKKFENAVTLFLYKLRKNNKNAKIVWVYGMLGTPIMEYIYKGVIRYKEDSSDRSVSIFQLPDTTQDTVGARSHPGVKSHKECAVKLAEYLKQQFKL